MGLISSLGGASKLIGLVARAGNLLMDYLARRRKQKAYKKRQEERDKIEEDPTDWFGEHFSGDRMQLDAESKSDAPKADKAKD